MVMIGFQTYDVPAGDTVNVNDGDFIGIHVSSVDSQAKVNFDAELTAEGE